MDIVVFDESDPYEREKFGRRVRLDFNNRPIFVISPEDLIISKLKWSKTAFGSERQIEDCRSVLSMNDEDIDKAYIDKWVRELKLEEEYSKLLK